MSDFNIDAKINAAWVVLGLLYGDGDFGKTMEIAAEQAMMQIVILDQQQAFLALYMDTTEFRTTGSRAR